MSKNKHVHRKAHKTHEEHNTSTDYRNISNSTYEMIGILTDNPYVDITKSQKSF